MFDDTTLRNLQEFIRKRDNREFLDFSINNLHILTHSSEGDSEGFQELKNENWKKGPGHLKKFDSIYLKSEDIPGLDEYFYSWNRSFFYRYYESPDPEPKELEEKELSEIIGDGLWFIVTSVDPIDQSVEMYCYQQPETPEQDEKVEEGIPLDEIREWTESKIFEQSGFILLSQLGAEWAQEKGSAYKRVLGPHNMTLRSLVQDIYDERGEELYWIDRELAGGRIRPIGPEEDKETLEHLVKASRRTTDPTVSWLTKTEERKQRKSETSERPAVKERKRSAEFGPVARSFRLISDYLRSLSGKPKTLNEFNDLNEKFYRRRITASRSRYLGVQKSDKLVWAAYNDEKNVYLTPEAVLKQVLLEAGLTEEEAHSLLEQSKDVG